WKSSMDFEIYENYDFGHFLGTFSGTFWGHFSQSSKHRYINCSNNISKHRLGGSQDTFRAHPYCINDHLRELT
ncbi:MAG: hypothetical protein Q8834_02925, partial [Candidatus Phytoplasma australasiaticum]|nr:hypothetical protein [Candidatus Phytoplasma australasiaticum]